MSIHRLDNLTKNHEKMNKCCPNRFPCICFSRHTFFEFSSMSNHAQWSKLRMKALRPYRIRVISDIVSAIRTSFVLWSQAIQWTQCSEIADIQTLNIRIIWVNLFGPNCQVSVLITYIIFRFNSIHSHIPKFILHEDSNSYLMRMFWITFHKIESILCHASLIWTMYFLYS